MGKLFVRIYDYFAERKMVFYSVLIFLFIVIGFFASRIGLEEDISKILPNDKKIDKLNELFRNSHFIDKLAVTVSLKDTNAVDPDSLVLYAENFVNGLDSSVSEYISKINARIDDSIIVNMLSLITDHLPVFLDEADYRSIDSLNDAARLREKLRDNIRTLSSPAGFALKNMIVKDPAGITFLALKKLRQLQYDENFDVYDGYILTKDQKHLMIFITPRYSPENTGMNQKMLAGIDRTMGTLSENGFGNISTSYFGAAAVSLGNAEQLRHDSAVTQIITIAFLLVFIGFYFRRKRIPFLILLPVIFGGLFSLMMVYFIKGNISVIALGTGSIIFGIAVNYSLHVFNHYRHTNDIQQVLRDLAMPMTIGSFTTVGGFFCLEFVKSEMLKDLGLFTAFSLIGAALFSLIFLPHLIVTGRETKIREQYIHLEKISLVHRKYEKYYVLLIILITVILFPFSGKVEFESDMMKMNYMPDRLRNSEELINRISSYSLQSVYLVTEGRNLNEALENNEKISGDINELKREGIVKKYSGVSSILISDSLQSIRIKKWEKYWTQERKNKFLGQLKNAGDEFKFRSTAFDPFIQMLERPYSHISIGDLAAIRNNFLGDFISESRTKATVITMLKVDRARKQSIYDLFERNRDVTVVDKQYVTNRLVEIVKSDFTSIAVMTSMLVFIVMLITYGRIELALVSFIPMFITWIWILGLMSIFDIRFNIINIIISALIFGLGDDYSLFIMDGLLQEYKTGRKNLDSYKSSILLSAITITAGLGVLVFAKHPALHSIAIISIIGMACVVLISLVMIPVLFRLLITNRTNKKKFPWTFTGLAKSIFAFSYFILGCIILTPLGFIFVKLNPFNRQKGKLILHFFISKFAWSLMYIMGNVKKIIINQHHENFSKPAVIICNHQSFLDILSTVMLNTKLVLLTNEWVWNSPFFGAVVRMADYYPVAKGAEESIELLSARVKEGYSIIVFPEGTRSTDGKIARFHKGAFFLAEKLNLDLLPIVIHGTGYTMSKSDFLLKDGVITLKFLPRIKPRDAALGNTYQENAKKISRYFRDEYEKLRSGIETAKYYSEQLKYNYLYKGPVLEWYEKIKVRLEDYYAPIDSLLPSKGKFLDIGCGYGFMSYMLKFLSPERNITGIDYDEDKIEVANHCFSKSEGIRFYPADALSFEFEKYDCIILADVLHYLQPQQQRDLFRRCAENLLPGGTMLIREGDSEKEERHKGTKLTEFFSTRFFRFNKTSGSGLSFIEGNTIRQLAAEHGLQISEIDTTKYTSNIIYVLKS